MHTLERQPFFPHISSPPAAFRLVAPRLLSAVVFQPYPSSSNRRLQQYLTYIFFPSLHRVGLFLDQVQRLSLAIVSSLGRTSCAAPQLEADRGPHRRLCTLRQSTGSIRILLLGLKPSSPPPTGSVPVSAQHPQAALLAFPLRHWARFVQGATFQRSPLLLGSEHITTADLKAEGQS